MSELRYELRRGRYYDSVQLMQLQRELAGREGIEEAGVVMATEANLALLASRDLLPDLPSVADEDLLIVLRGMDEETIEAGLEAVDGLLERKRAAGAVGYRPRTLESAAEHLPQAQWVLVSVPGRYAADVASEALDLGRHVFLFSDNVPIERERELKRAAWERGQLVMGPDCGTAIIGGIGLGFANHVRSGPIGIVAASGTGLQAISSGIHELGSGVSQAIGTGGRDLKEPIGGVTTLQGLDLLGRDPATRAIVVVSKPPDAAVVPGILTAARSVDKPVVVFFQGWSPPAARLGPVHFARDLTEAAQLAVELAAVDPSDRLNDRITPSPTGRLRGLFSGGTLAHELFRSLRSLLPGLRSNVASDPEDQPADPFKSEGDLVLDLGADEFTEGRLHPMMDNELRLDRLAREGADPEVGVIVLDVVLGEGSHPDPVAELGPAIAQLTDRDELEIAVVIVGTGEDPQGLEAQKAGFQQAGARVYGDVTQLAADLAVVAEPTAWRPESPVPLDGLKAVAALNVGLQSFAESLQGQGTQAISLDWRPPAGGNEDMMDLLSRMEG